MKMYINIYICIADSLCYIPKPIQHWKINYILINKLIHYKLGGKASTMFTHLEWEVEIFTFHWYLEERGFFFLPALKTELGSKWWKGIGRGSNNGHITKLHRFQHKLPIFAEKGKTKYSITEFLNFKNSQQITVISLRKNENEKWKLSATFLPCLARCPMPSRHCLFRLHPSQSSLQITKRQRHHRQNANSTTVLGLVSLTSLIRQSPVPSNHSDPSSRAPGNL